MAGICDGRIVIVTGAGRGSGRGHALEFARQGAKVVVNDLGGEVDGTGGSLTPGEAVANGEDVSSWEGAKNLVDQAIETFGGLDVLVNNAGILRDRMLVNMEEAEWDAVIRVHLKGTFAPSRHAAAWWRERSKAGQPVDARIINTSSGSGLYGNPGQTNYGAAKAGIASFTIIAAKELERYGVTVNAVSPGARTRMTESLGFGRDVPADGFDAADAENVAPVVVWLGSEESRGVTGRVIEASGGRIGIAMGWSRGPRLSQDARWEPDAVGSVILDLLEQAGKPESLSGA